MTSGCQHWQCLVILLKCGFLCGWFCCRSERLFRRRSGLGVCLGLCSWPVERAAWAWFLIKPPKAPISCLLKLFCE